MVKKSVEAKDNDYNPILSKKESRSKTNRYHTGTAKGGKRPSQFLVSESWATAREGKQQRNFMSTRSTHRNQIRNLQTDVLLTKDMLGATASSCEKEVQTVDIDTSLSDREVPMMRANPVFSLKNPSKRQLDFFSSQSSQRNSKAKVHVPPSGYSTIFSSIERLGAFSPTNQKHLREVIPKIFDPILTV